MTPQFTIQSDYLGDNSVRFVLEPLPQGFGHTLGNSLRRVLYTSIPSAAITSVSITGITHQFTTIPGVKEDVVEIILALKQVRLRYSKDAPATISLSAKGHTEITAGDFELPSDVTIANPGLVIAHLTDKSAKLEIEAVVESGLGFSPVEERQRSTVGTIPVAATFTPVARVNFEVVATRVGRVTNFDKLVLDVTTGGTITPQPALDSAAGPLVGYFGSIVNPQTPASNPAMAGPASAGPTRVTLSIEAVDFPTPLAKALQ